MPGVDNRRLVQRPELRVNGIGQQIKIATRICNIRSPDRPCEQGIPDEHMVWTPFYREQEAATPKGVSRGMENSKFNASKGVRFLCFE